MRTCQFCGADKDESDAAQLRITVLESRELKLAESLRVLVGGLNDAELAPFVETCRNSGGPCFCGCHTGTVAMEDS